MLRSFMVILFDICYNSLLLTHSNSNKVMTKKDGSLTDSKLFLFSTLPRYSFGLKHKLPECISLILYMLIHMVGVAIGLSSCDSLYFVSWCVVFHLVYVSYIYTSDMTSLARLDENIYFYLTSHSFQRENKRWTNTFCRYKIVVFVF